MNELINIKVIQKDFNGGKKRFVNARELHRWFIVLMRKMDYYLHGVEFGGIKE